MEKEKVKNKRYFYYPIFFALVLIAGIYIGRHFTVLSQTTSTEINNPFSFQLNNYNKVNDVINYIYKSYVDTVNKKDLERDAIKGILESLDPHSYYISSEEFNQTNDPLLGSFDGIGIEFRIIKDTVVVLNPISGGPSKKVGIRAGDRIVKVEKQTIAGVKISNEKVVKLLKGKRGSQVNVAIYRNGVNTLLDFCITRDKIPMNSLDIAYMVDEEIGYVKISRFSATTHKEFVSSLKNLKQQGMKKLILDLRGNTGGYLDAAIDMADELLVSNKLVVYTQGKNRAKTTAYSTERGEFEQGNIAILIDDWSASASEIVSGAIQDNDRGWIIGRRSFGKGLVQEQVLLKDGSAVRLTIARYYTPSGRCIQKPYKAGLENYYTEFYNRFVKGEVDGKDSMLFEDSLKYKTLSGRIVYGGGGIMPDIFIPVDRAGNSNYFAKLVSKGLIYQFAFDYSDKKREYFNKKYKTSNEFIDNFFVTKDLLFKFVAYAQKNEVPQDTKGLKISEKIIKLRLKAYIGRDLYNDEAFFPVLNKEDNTFNKALDVLRSDEDVISN